MSSSTPERREILMAGEEMSIQQLNENITAQFRHDERIRLLEQQTAAMKSLPLEMRRMEERTQQDLSHMEARLIAEIRSLKKEADDDIKSLRTTKEKAAGNTLQVISAIAVWIGIFFLLADRLYN